MNREEQIARNIEQSISYQEYRDLVNELVKEGKTSGPNQGEDYAQYTKMNSVRMKRLDKTTEILPETKEGIEAIDSKQTWLIITEAWCGDAAQILPVIEKIAGLNDQITTRFVFRDPQDPKEDDLINFFLTDGGKGIPQVIIWDENRKEVLGSFGPRPSEMQAIVMGRKDDPNASPYSEFVIDVQKWYAAEKTFSIQKEFIEVLKGVNVL